VETLGPDAVVITTRPVTGTGLRGWFGASDIEIAAVLPTSTGAHERMNAQSTLQSKAGRFAPGVYARSASLRPPSDVAALRAELKCDIRALKTMISKGDESGVLAGELAQLRELIEGIAEPRVRNDKVTTRLRCMGIEGPAATSISRVFRGKQPAPEALRNELSRGLRVTAWPLDAERSLIALVGPTGVGKTTTAAKLAAQARMAGRTVTLVGCDSFRVGAAEQLARYAGLIGTDLATAKTSDELANIILDVRSNVVIVDTSGRSPTADGVELALVPSRRAAPTGGRTRNVLLCVPASLRAVDASRVSRTFNVLCPTSLAITKIDETNAPAGIVHATWASKLPISVLCFGQRVPEDVSSATVDVLVDHVSPKKAA
jgi:flagellar biosynthesis protein FlhF